MGNGTSTGSESGGRVAGGAVRRRPGAGRAFRAQLRLLGRRRAGLAAMTLVVAGSVAVQATDVFGSGSIALSHAVAGFWTWGGLIALFWSVGLTWKDEGPSERTYHWTLPVDRPLHHLLRMAAGWVTLGGTLAGGILLGWAGGALLQGSMSAGDPAVLAGVLPAATVLYLVGGLFALTVDRPLLWFILAYVGAAGLRGVGALAGWTWLETVIRQALLSGPHSLTAAASVPRSVSGVLGGSGITWAPWRAAGLWLVVTVVLTVGAAWLHREPSGRG